MPIVACPAKNRFRFETNLANGVLLVMRKCFHALSGFALISTLLFGAAYAKKKKEPTTQSMAQFILKELNVREQEAYDEYSRAIEKADVERVQTKLQGIVSDYERLVKAAPEYAPAFVSYGLMLHRVGERDASNAMFVKADELDPTIPVVKNQLGNYMAEEGEFTEALGFYLMATELDPDEPLYHHQIGNLMHAYRKLFVAEKMYDNKSLDLLMQENFRKSVELAPDHWQYRLRYAQSFFDVTKPDWIKALEQWQELVLQAPGEFEKQMSQLYMAKTRYELQHHTAARKILKKIDHPNLDRSKQELIDLLDTHFPK